MVIAEIADERQAPLTTVSGPLLGYSINLAGQHQAENAKLAVETLNALGVHLSFDSVQHALASVSWPGRFETLSETPHIIIDGAHNPHAARTLVSTWQEQFKSQKATLVFGAVEEKDVRTVLETLCQISCEIHLTPIDSPRTLSTDALQNILPPTAPAPTTHTDLASCLQSLKEHSSPVLVSGSLFLIGEAKALAEQSSFQRSSQ